MEEKPKVYREDFLEVLTALHADFLWINRGMLVDNDYKRIESDWQDAVRMVGFKIGDDVLTDFKRGIYFNIPNAYFKYLNSITIEEYKNIKAYFIWKERESVRHDDQDSDKEDYLKACSFLPEEEYLMKEGKIHPLSTLLDYISAVTKEARHKKQVVEETGLEKPSTLFEKELSNREVKIGKGKLSDIKRVLKNGLE